jgi:hypothetical protein
VRYVESLIPHHTGAACDIVDRIMALYNCILISISSIDCRPNSGNIVIKVPSDFFAKFLVCRLKLRVDVRCSPRYLTVRVYGISIPST